jgi:hypothetical protein
MNAINLRSLFSNYNFPKEEMPRKLDLSHEEKLRIATTNLSKFADFHEIITKLYEIKGADMISHDPALQLLNKLKELNAKNS